MFLWALLANAVSERSLPTLSKPRQSIASGKKPICAESAAPRHLRFGPDKASTIRVLGQRKGRSRVVKTTVPPNYESADFDRTLDG
jgi:hypothetical protein